VVGEIVRHTATLREERSLILRSTFEVRAAQSKCAAADLLYITIHYYTLLYITIH